MPAASKPSALKTFLKNLIKRIPFPLSRNHGYDLCTAALIRKLPEDATTIDVGCHKGEILDQILRAAPRGMHYGLEPLPHMYEQLRNKYQAVSQAKILNVAASDEQGTAAFNFVESNPAYSGLLRRKYDREGEVDQSIEVQVDLLDNLIPASQKIDFIKIDVEGAELKVLRGARQLISTHKPIIVFEHGLGGADVYQYGPDDVFDFFAELGMKIYRLRRKSTPPIGREAFNKLFHSGEEYYYLAKAT